MYSFCSATEIFRKKKLALGRLAVKDMEVLVVGWKAPFLCPPLFTAKSNTSIN